MKPLFLLILVVLHVSDVSSQLITKERSSQYDSNDSIAKDCEKNPKKCGFIPIKKAQKIAAAAIKNEHLKCNCEPYYTGLHYRDSSKVFYFTFGYWEWLERPMKLKIDIEINANTGEVIDKQKNIRHEKHPITNNCFCDEQRYSSLPNTVYPFKEFIKKNNKIIADGIIYNYISYYKETGKIKELGNFKKSGKSKDDKIKHWMYFNENGKLIEEGNYENGLKTGLWNYHYSKGQKEKECNYQIVTKETEFLTRPTNTGIPAKRKKIKTKVSEEKKCTYWDEDEISIDSETYYKLKFRKLVKYAGQYLTLHVADSLFKLDKKIKKQKQDSLLNAIDSLIAFFPDEKIKSITWRKGQKQILKKMEWYENGNLYYHNDYEKETQVVYYENGQKQSEKIGESYYAEWHPDGNKKMECSEGNETKWYENGNKMRETKTMEGKRKERFWWKNGQKMAEGTYESYPYLASNWSFWNRDRKFIGYGTIYPAEGDMCTDGYWVMFSSDDFNNVYKRFYKKCNLVSEEIIKQ